MMPNRDEVESRMPGGDQIALAGSALLTNAVGLHARPSVKLTQVAKRFEARIEFALDPAGPWADAKSPVKVMRTKAAKGSTLHFRVKGSDAPEALAAMLSLVERRFDEEGATHVPAAGSERRYKGRPAAPGVALGLLFVVGEVVAERVATGNPESEVVALRSAIADALSDLHRMVERAQGEAADILGFQVALLEDAVFAERAFGAIADGRAAHEAWLATVSAEAEAYESSEDEYFRARVADVRDIRDRVQAHLTGSAADVEVPPGAVVAAVDLPPSRFLAIDWSRGGAVVLTGGSPTSHVAMLARARGVPAVVGLGVPLSELSGEALVYATRGVVVVQPGPAERAAFERESRVVAAERAVAAELATVQATTKDGTRIRVLINIACAGELEGVDPAICDGIGLVRTELWFHDHAGLPGEEAQYAGYRRIVEWARGRPVTIRTLDAGGDKPIAGLTLDKESNPFLGVRGLRLSFAAPEIFRTQLRALLRAAVHGEVKLMLPMVTLPRELEQARAMLARELAGLQAAGVPARRPSLGIMVEVPAAAIAADLFEADFFSIGSNDLTQYVAAAGRDVNAVAELADPTQPAVLRLVRHVVEVAAARGIEASLCGDAAGDPAAIPALLGAGLRTLSVAPALVGRTKLAIASADLRDVQGVKSWLA
jgi:phosphotransferase system enzyme I (PtsI)